MAEAASVTTIESWEEIVVRVLKANAVRLVTYVPDKMLAPLLASAAHERFRPAALRRKRSSSRRADVT